MPVWSEQALRAAAFGGSPGMDVWAAAAPDRPARHRWLAAVVLGGQGHYAAAATALDPLLDHPDQVLAALAASTLAAHRRQLGGHRAARPLDGLALRLVCTVPDRAGGQCDEDGADLAGARIDAYLGLAADAVGTGQVAVAGRLLTAAGRPHGPGRPPSAWRQRVRFGWLRAETELAAGRAGDAVEPARQALAAAVHRGAVRHVAKSELVLAAALATAGRPEPAAELLRSVTGAVVQHGLAPLGWPAHALLARMPTQGRSADAATHRQQAEWFLRLVLRRADAPLRAAAARSPWVPSELLRAAGSAERSSAGKVLGENYAGLCQGSSPRDR